MQQSFAVLDISSSVAGVLDQRQQAPPRFQSGDVDTLMVTDVAARGIDVEGISHVINFHPPGDHDSYIHRVGRSGRAGRSGVGITLVGSEERRDMNHRARLRRAAA
jgi:ATP-dependent RNA helicase RhlE